MDNTAEASTTVRGRIFQGLLATAYGRGVLVIGQILLVPVLITHWTAVGYGEWVTLSAVAAYLGYANLGMPGALRAHMALAYSGGGLAAMRTAFQTSFILITAMALLIFFVFVAGVQLTPVAELLHLQWMSQGEARLVVCILGGQLALYAISSVPSAALSSLGRYAQASLFDAHRQSAEFAITILMVGVWRLSPGAVALVYPVTWAVFGGSTLLALYRRAPWLFQGPPCFDPGVLRQLAKPMLGVLGMTFGYVGVSVQAPRVILAMTIGPSAVAVYALASMMTRIVRIPIDIPAHSVTVEVSLAVGAGDRAGARRMLGVTTRVCFWLALALVPLVILAGPAIAQVWSNGRVAVPVDLIAILSVSTIFFSLALPCQETLMAVNRLVRTTGWLIASAPPFLVLCWVCARTFGVDGAALSLVALDLTYAALALTTAARFLGDKDHELLRGLAVPPLGLLRQELAGLVGRLRARRA
jgi:O-antigen/teichoic acid export membrane protein